ncbi:MAG: prepilin peptidase [Candidatus Daviesbacteria bacterium]
MLSAVVGFIIGLVLGSFVKATADRVPGKSLRGRSYCSHCKRELQWYDLLPVLSYLSLKGKCRYCQKKIPVSNLWAELIMGGLISLLFLAYIPDLAIFLNLDWKTILLGIDLVFAIFVISILSIIFLIDLRTGLIPDKITYPAVIITFAYLLVSKGLKSWFLYQGLISGPLGKYLMPPYSNFVYDYIGRVWLPFFWAILTGTLLSLVFAILIIITRGKGMGWGDVKYVLFLGLALGFPNGVMGVFLAFFVGAVVSLFLVAFGKKHFGQTVPFGPFLSIGAYIAFLAGQKIIDWYGATLM